MNKIEINCSCPELVAAINTLAAAISGKSATPPAAPAPAPAPPAPSPQMPLANAGAPYMGAPVYNNAPPQGPPPGYGAPAQAPPAPLPTASPAPFDLAEIQRACAPLIDAGRQQEINGLIAGMGFHTLSQIPPERQGELINGLRGLGVRI